MTLVLYGEQTKARFLAFYADKKIPVAFDIEEGDEYPTIESISKELNEPITRIEERRDYYWLPLQPHFNQPCGYVSTISLFPTDYYRLKSADYHITHPYWYIYDNYIDACRRADD